MEDLLEREREHVTEIEKAKTKTKRIKTTRHSLPTNKMEGFTLLHLAGIYLLFYFYINYLLLLLLFF